MKTRELEAALAAADPVDRDRLDRVDPEAMDAELLADLDDEHTASPPLESGARNRHRRRSTLALGTAALAAIVAAVVILAGGTSSQPSRAYGAELVRFAESTPLLLLDGPGWRVQNLVQHNAHEGTMEFVTGKPIPYETITITGDVKSGWRQSGMFPAAVRQRRVELFWRRGTLQGSLRTAREMPHPHGQLWSQAPVLETTAYVDQRAEFYVNQGGPGNRQMTALWSEGDHVLEMKAAVPDLEAFEERLGWLTRVDSQTWLDAMPPKVVKAADHGAAVREMLKGIPVPDDFTPSRVPNPGFTTDRYQVGAAVTGTVSCLWFLQWGEARRSGDRAGRIEAERAMATSRRWPILREMNEDGAYPELIWELAAAMPKGYWEWRGRERRLLAHAEGLGCARQGLPLLPWKQRLQRERGDR